MKPKIAILETIHPDGVRGLKAFAKIDHLEEYSRPALLKKIGIYDGIIVKSNIQVDTEFVGTAKKLSIVGRAGVGTDNIDKKLLHDKGIRLVTVPSGNTISTAEFTIGMMITMTRRLPEISKAIAHQDFRRHLYEGRELGQLTVGILGLGQVGMAVAERLQPFGCRLLGYDRTQKNASAFRKLGGEMSSTLSDMLPHLDVLSLHVPVTPETEGMIDQKVFNLIKPGCILINTARGLLINDQDLIAALDSEKLQSAAIDVIHPEPPYNGAPEKNNFKHQILNHEKIFYTPHFAASTQDAQRKIALRLVQSMKKHLSGDE
jgi:D-3-phosphoglycerate dehydrogenase